MHFYCFPEMFDLNISPMDRVVLNLFERNLIQAFRLASFLCLSPTWRKCSDKLGQQICELIFHMARRINEMINKWKRQSQNLHCPIFISNMQYISTSAFRLLWNKGPHKVQIRSGEKKVINNLWKHLREEGAHKMITGQLIELPSEMYAPFDQILL